MITPAPAVAAARPDVSVIVPIFDQAAYLPRALAGLLSQRGPSWELIVVDDGSSDRPEDVVSQLLGERPYRSLRFDANRGLGAAANAGLDSAAGRYVAYLPADDVWFDGHLAALVSAVDTADATVVGAYSGVRIDGGLRPGSAADHGLRMVQVLHRRDVGRWRERSEFESDDLHRTVWRSLYEAGKVLATGAVTCEWTRRPGSRSDLLRGESDGGLNPFRRHYGVATRLRIEPSDGDPVDEHELYGTLDAPAAPPQLPAPAQPPEPAPLPAPTPPAVPPPPASPGADDLHVLLVGELAYNADRMIDLAARGVRLSGLWIDDPLGFMSIGPVPFLGITDLPASNWINALRADPPDVLYCLLNWRSVPLALAVAETRPDLPLVWHFKEAPQRCLARGDWPRLVALWDRATSVLVCSDEERDWLLDALPGRRDPATVEVMDGDRPRGRWFTEPPEAAMDPTAPPAPGPGIHTVCVGRPTGLNAQTVAVLARAGIHLHLHGLPAAARGQWLAELRTAGAGYVHLHPAVPPPRWRRVLSRYDAGWLQAVAYPNGGDLRRATWDNLNLPARLPTLAAADLPLLLPALPGSVSAINRVADETGAGLAFADADDLVDRLRHEAARHNARQAMTAARHRFSFDADVERLTATLTRSAGRAVVARGS